MMLIGEGGSTKTDWRLLGPTGEAIAAFTGSGLNPNVLNPEQIETVLQDEVAPLLATNRRLEAIFFYGPALGSDALRAQLQSALRSIAPQAHVAAEHDLLAAARSTAGEVPCIVGILGTGSNSGRYNGRRIAESYGGHGYMLGDEGSGFDLGRRLLVAALDRQLPPWEAEAFAHWLQQDFEAYKATVYQAERPNAALAELALFLQDHQERPAFARLIDQAFEAYLQSTVLQYEAPRRYRLNFVGSVAYHYQAPLRNTCHRHGLSIDAILERPIDALAAYHQTRRYEQRH